MSLEIITKIRKNSPVLITKIHDLSYFYFTGFSGALPFLFFKLFFVPMSRAEFSSLSGCPSQDLYNVSSDISSENISLNVSCYLRFL